jgi:hypothetical protein
MNKIVLLILLSIFIISCSSSKVPFGIRKTITELDNELNDTIKYDYKIAPEQIATNKYSWSFDLHTPNGHSIKGQKRLLKLYFKLNGVSDSYHMSEIIRTTYHRYLNNEPINFHEQTKYFKAYERLLKRNMDSAFEWDERNRSIKKYREKEKEYFDLYTDDKIVTGTIMAWKKYSEISSAGTDVEFIGRVIKLKERDLFVQIIQVEKPKKGFKLYHKVGDTIQRSAYDVILVPNE